MDRSVLYMEWHLAKYVSQCAILFANIIYFLKRDANFKAYFSILSLKCDVAE